MISRTVRQSLAAVTFMQIENATCERCEMETTPADVYEEEVCVPEAARHIACARHLLKELSTRLRRSEDYPELQEAITKLEVALTLLTVNSGGML